jgi:RimJ/RimL family protein N-acetyltransferase
MQETQTFRAKNSDEITLRPAVPEDAGEIIKTVRSTSIERSYVLMEHYGKNAETEKKYIMDLDRSNNLLLVALARGDVVGSLAALQAYKGHIPQTAHILTIGLHLIESYRGQGIGSQMLQYAIEWAKERGFKKIETSIFTANKRSLHLFSKAGFREEGTRQKRIRVGNDFIDEVLLGKFLE